MQIPHQISRNSTSFKSNKEFHLSELRKLSEKISVAKEGGGEKYQQRLRSQGKMSARERVECLIDRGSSFLELSTLAGYGLYETDVPSAGIVTGIGLIHNRPCMIVANDSTVKGGTYFPITVKKHLRAQEIAEKNHLPCVYLVDSGGAFLPMQDEVFPDKDDFGRIFYNQARMSAKGIPQLSSVHGFCTAGGAYIPSMSDQSVIVKGTGTIFLAGPPLVKAATGEDVTAEELGGSQVHTSISGVADHEAENDEHALLILREIVSHLGSHRKMEPQIQPSRPPLFDGDDILGVLPSDLKAHFDMRDLLACILDESRLFEFKKNYGQTLVTGFAHICGIPVGVIGNNGILFSESALKGTHFINLCTQEKIPLLFLQNITGFMVGKEYEHGGIAKNGAKLVHAVANADVPKLTLLVGGSYGAGNYGMCGRGYDPNFLFMYPRSRISVMGGEQAANVLATVKEQQGQRKGESISEKELNELKKPILEKYEEESSAYYATARLWDDGVIDPRDTRSVLSQALMASMHHQWPETKFGVFRM